MSKDDQITILLTDNQHEQCTQNKSAKENNKQLMKEDFMSGKTEAIAQNLNYSIGVRIKKQIRIYKSIDMSHKGS